MLLPSINSVAAYRFVGILTGIVIICICFEYLARCSVSVKFIPHLRSSPSRARSIAFDVSNDLLISRDGNTSGANDYSTVNQLSISLVTNSTLYLSSNTTSRSLGAITYFPGQLNVKQNGLILSAGLKSRIIAKKGQAVQFILKRGQSKEKFHADPDAGATFADPSPNNEGGWIYVSNSEIRNTATGGVGAITFNKDGGVIAYKRVQSNTRANCGGGKTPWGAWISCEEFGGGQCWQVDPTGTRKAAKITMGIPFPGPYESFAYDVRNKKAPAFFITKDDKNGELRRFIPSSPNWNDPWSILFRPGKLDFLDLKPKSVSEGRYEWVNDANRGKESARKFFPNAEGIDVRNNELFFISKERKSMFILNLDNGTYKNFTTVAGLFKGQPDQILRIVPNDGILYFTEDGNKPAGIHGRNANGKYFTILEGPGYADETTGLAFSPNNKHMYVAYQDNGILFEITRIDGLPFDGQVLNVKYH